VTGCATTVSAVAIASTARHAIRRIARCVRNPAMPSPFRLIVNGQLGKKHINTAQDSVMALYKYAEYLAKSDDASFDGIHRPGQTPPHSGIYGSTGCGREVVAEEGRQLPPQNHHQHTTQQGEIRWRMIVYADHRPK
jgi:hypothetical protein